jgi:hypothetical protein
MDINSSLYFPKCSSPLWFCKSSVKFYICFYIFQICKMKGKVKLYLCWTNWALRHEGVWEIGCIDPRLIDIGTCWRWVVSFTLRPLYPRGKSPRYALDRRLGGLQNLSGLHGEDKILAPTGTRTLTPRSSNPWPVRWVGYEVRSEGMRNAIEHFVANLKG